MLSYFNCVWLFATQWSIASQAPLSMGFSRQGHWSRFLGPPPGDLPNLGIELRSFMSPALAGGFFTTSANCESSELCFCVIQGQTPAGCNLTFLGLHSASLEPICTAFWECLCLPFFFPLGKSSVCPNLLIFKVPDPVSLMSLYISSSLWPLLLWVTWPFSLSALNLRGGSFSALTLVLGEGFAGLGAQE